MPPIDDRCEFLKLRLSFDKRVLTACYVERDACIEEHISEHASSRDQAEDYCWKRPLSIDSSFVGPCPLHMEALEANENADDDSVLRRIYLRNHFNLLNEFGADIDVFKRQESEASVSRILASNPDHPIALHLLAWLSLFDEDLVNRLDLYLQEQKLDPDCPQNRSLIPWFIYSQLSEILEHWLAGKGSGSELTKEEIRNLLLRVDHTLLETYNLGIKQSDGAGKLHWALESLYDAILSRRFENFQQIASRVEIGLDYAKKRRADLIQKFSSEYDTDSDHGRSKSLTFACSALALELGLLDHCVKLLSHFGVEDSNSFDSPASDWTQATISLMIVLTRDCSKPATYLLHGPLWWNEHVCLAEHQHVLESKIRELLGRFSEFGDSAAREVLEAYLRLDETSGERFRRALALDDSMIVYASRLIKRLHRLGKVQTATDILSGIDTATPSRLTMSEERLLNNATNSITEGEYRNWSESSWGFLSESYSRADNP